MYSNCPSFDTRKCVLGIQNNELLCLARVLVPDMTRRDWNSIRQERQRQKNPTKALHQKADVPKSLFGLPEVTTLQQFIDDS